MIIKIINKKEETQYYPHFRELRKTTDSVSFVDLEAMLNPVRIISLERCKAIYLISGETGKTIENLYKEGR